MPRTPKSPAEVRAEAARMCRELALDCIVRGADESADALREIADDIRRMRLTKDEQR